MYIILSFPVRTTSPLLFIPKGVISLRALLIGISSPFSISPNLSASSAVGL